MAREQVPVAAGAMMLVMIGLLAGYFESFPGPADRRRLALVTNATHLFLEDLGALRREARTAWEWLAGPG